MDRLRDEAWSRNAVDQPNLLLGFSKPHASLSYNTELNLASYHGYQAWESLHSVSATPASASKLLHTLQKPSGISLSAKKHRDVPRVSAIITNGSPPPHRQSAPWRLL